MFKDIKIGDIVSRSFGGSKNPMKLNVTDVNEKFIYCGPDGIGWKFRRDCGAEVDEELEWGLDSNPIKTGSFLIKKKK